MSKDLSMGARNLAGVLLLCVAPSAAWAAVTAEEAAKLGRELTPIGAERASNTDQTIPEWKGGEMTPPAGWTVG